MLQVIKFNFQQRFVALLSIMLRFNEFLSGELIHCINFIRSKLEGISLPNAFRSAKNTWDHVIIYDARKNWSIANVGAWNLKNSSKKKIDAIITYVWWWELDENNKQHDHAWLWCFYRPICFLKEYGANLIRILGIKTALECRNFQFIDEKFVKEFWGFYFILRWNIWFLQTIHVLTSLLS